MVDLESQQLAAESQSSADTLRPASYSSSNIETIAKDYNLFPRSALKLRKKLLNCIGTHPSPTCNPFLMDFVNVLMYSDSFV